MSLMAAIRNSSLRYRIRKKFLPMRPKPINPMFTMFTGIEEDPPSGRPPWRTAARR